MAVDSGKLELFSMEKMYRDRVCSSKVQTSDSRFLTVAVDVYVGPSMACFEISLAGSYGYCDGHRARIDLFHLRNR